MITKTSEVGNGVKNEKNRTLSGHLAEVSLFPTATSTATKSARVAKDTVEYWKERICHRALKDGTQTAELYVRFQTSGRDSWVCLDTANRATAANKARRLWVDVQSKGLDVAIAEFHPKAEARAARVCTVGEYIDAARAVSTARSRTFGQYEAALRRVVAGVAKIDGTAARFAPNSPGNAEWRAKIDGTRLDKLTPSAVKAWQKGKIDAASDEAARAARAHTVASHVRNARALFSVDLLAELRKALTLPAELPFAGVPVASTTRRFESTVDPRALYAAATASLDADTRAAFLLLLIGGLRRGEADLLPWANVSLAAGTVRVETTKWFTPKSTESTRTVPLPADVVQFLAGLRATAPEAEFVLRGTPPRAAARSYLYRADAWEPLTEWLRGQGVKTLTPLHSLRKMSGSLIYSTAGIEAARRHLGHRDISTTAASYLQSGAATVNLAAPS
jgi:integrase